MNAGRTLKINVATKKTKTVTERTMIQRETMETGQMAGLERNRAILKTEMPASNFRVTEDSDDYESNCLVTENDKQTPSSEILVAIPRDKGSKRY